MFPNSSRAAWVTAETGFQAAKACSTGGSVANGTNVFATNVSGKITMKAALLTTSGLGTSIPIHAMIQEIAYAKPSSSANPPTASATLELIPADEEPRQRHDDQHEHVVDHVRDRAARQDGGRCHRQRSEAVDDPLLHVVGQPGAGDRRAEDHRLGEDPRHEELAVGLAVPTADRATEDEREQQHEHDRLQRREDEQVRHALDLDEVALGDHGRVGEHVGEAHAWTPSLASA